MHSVPQRTTAAAFFRICARFYGLHTGFSLNTFARTNTAFVCFICIYYRLSQFMLICGGFSCCFFVRFVSLLHIVLCGNSCFSIGYIFSRFVNAYNFACIFLKYSKKRRIMLKFC